MDSTTAFINLFTHASFFALKKEVELEESHKTVLSRLEFDPGINKFHPKRKEEFQLGRLCAYQAYLKHFKKELLSLPMGSDRGALWPTESVGSISHDQYWIGAAVAKSSELFGLGIDFEVMGRVKPELKSHITNEEDLLIHSEFNETELLTLLFSAKESLYKALHPKLKVYFGFEAAALRALDEKNCTFQIDLVRPIASGFGPGGKVEFHGRFALLDNSCLTVLEVTL